MVTTIEQTLDEYAGGRIGRREAVTRLAAAALALAGGARSVRAEQAVPTYVSRGLNHIALRVTDVERSRDFYQRHLGLRVLSSSSSNCFLDCGGGQFVALFRGGEAGLDHYCYTVDGYRPGDALERLRAAGLDPVRNANRVYFDDPDGLTVQLSGGADSWPG